MLGVAASIASAAATITTDVQKQDEGPGAKSIENSKDEKPSKGGGGGSPRGRKRTKSAALLWKKAFGTLRALRSFKVTAESCATCPIEDLELLFEEKAKFSGASPPKSFMRHFVNELRSMVPSFLEAVSEEIFHDVCIGLRLHVYAPDEVLIRVGDVPDGWYFIVAGSCSVYANNQDAEDSRVDGTTSRRLGTIKCGTGFGELGFLVEDARRSATIVGSTSHGVYCLFVEKDAYVQHLIRFMKKNDNVMETHKFLRSASILQWLDSRSLIQLAHGVVPRDLEPFETFKSQGELLEEVFVVRQGHVKLVQRIGNTSVTLALLGPGDIGGVSDLIIALARGKLEAHCRCAYRTEGQKAKILVIRRYGFEKTVLACTRLRPMVEDIVRIRLVWEAMRVRHKQRHPGTHMALTHNMMETYGYTRGPATDMVQKRRRTKDENDARRRLYEKGQMARAIFRSIETQREDGGSSAAASARRAKSPGHAIGGSGAWGSSIRPLGGSGANSFNLTRSLTKKQLGDTIKVRLSTASTSEQLKHAHELFVEAVNHAREANLPKESAIAEQLSRECLNALFMEDYTNLRMKAQNLSRLAISRVNSATVSISSIPTPAPLKVGHRGNADVEKMRKLTQRKLRVAKQASQAENKLMVAYSAWVRAASMCEAGLKVAMQANQKSRDEESPASSSDKKQSLSSRSGVAVRIDAAKVAMQRAMVECEKEQQILKRVMKKFALKQKELQAGMVQKRRSLQKAHDSSTENSSDEDLGLDWAIQEQPPTIETLLPSHSLDEKSVAFSLGDSIRKEARVPDLDRSRVNWNMQGGILPHKSSPSTTPSIGDSSKVKKSNWKGHLRSTIKITTGKAMSKAQVTSPSRPEFDSNRQSGQTSPLNKRKKKVVALHPQASKAELTIPDPLPRHIVDWHILVIEENKDAAALLRHHIETQARNSFSRSCVVDCLHHLPSEKKAMRFQVQTKRKGQMKEGEGLIPRFTCVVIDIGRLFPGNLSTKEIGQRKQKNWWDKALKRAKKVIENARSKLAPGTDIILTSGEVGYQRLLDKLTKDGFARGWVGKPVTAIGVRRILRQF